MLGADSDGGGESNLTYTWSQSGGPSGATFTANNTNAAKNTTVTFTQAGDYTFLATITDKGGLSTTSTVNVTVSQTLTSITVGPGSSALGSAAAQQFTASAYDQFGNTMQTQPAFTWSSTGAGSINATTGMYTASYASGSGTVTAASGSISGSAVVTVTDAAPTVATAAAAGSSTVTGTSTSLSVLGADSDGGGESNLTYTWSETGGPSGTTFAANGSNAAKNTIVTFTQAGDYTFLATITDKGGLSTTSTVNVTVSQTLTSITVGPSSSALGSAVVQQFTAAAFDQFGNTMQTQPAFTWSNTGAGSINSSTGLYTASYTSGTATVTATSGSVSGSAVVTVTDATPTVATAAKAGSSTVTGTSTSLSVLGADSDGGGESNLTYTWSQSGGPSGTTFAANGSNAAKNTIVTFTQAGDYTFLATITDKGGLSTTSTVNVTVSQTATSITVGPSSSALGSAVSQQFTAAAFDQFGNTMQMQPAFTWSNTGAGSINATTGLYTASYASGSGTVTATSGSVSGSTVVTVTDAAPTVATAAAAGSSTVTGTSTSLSVLGADSDGGGENNLTYTWSETGGPSGATFAANNTNAAKNTIVTFTQAGDYTFLATITDKGGLSTTSTVNVTVSQTLTSITVGPGGSALGSAATQQFTAAAYDQFGNTMQTQPAFTWSNTGAGSINVTTGLYTASYASGSGTVTAASGSVSGSTVVTVTDAAPTVATAAAAGSSTVTGTSTSLSVLGADSDGGGESNLTYTWNETGGPSGATFAANNTNAAKNTIVTFTQAGDYTFLATITDKGGLSTTSTVNVTVSQTLTSITVGPSSTRWARRPPSSSRLRHTINSATRCRRSRRSPGRTRGRARSTPRRDCTPLPTPRAAARSRPPAPASAAPP